MNKLRTVIGAMMGLCLAGTAHAAIVPVSSDITTSTTWTANNEYQLTKQIYVQPGATLTIQAGTLVRSVTGVGGSLAVTRGAKIYALGTKDKPIIMTSSSDDLLHWHQGANEWGNLTMMGKGLISASSYGGVAIPGNTATPTGLNIKQMEGLTAAFAGDPNVMYGGNDDNDNSGALHYVSLRYGGKVLGLGNELNGLSMGAIGRETDVDHIDVMNNVDDCMETWGGTVNYKYMSFWNCGDDGFDVDEGWRGKAQFGLIVQGYSADAARGSGVSDNIFEVDGAEESDAQPVTTAAIYNFTGIGQPLSARGGTAWRDNARVQYHNSILMDVGRQVVRFDNVDGDGQKGYGFNGTLDWPTTWTTPYTAHSSVNAGSWTPGAFNDPAVLYQSQTSGNLAEIKDTVFFENTYPGPDGTLGDAYSEATARGVFAAANNNVKEPALSPIVSITRGPSVTKGGLTILPVIGLDPRAANDAATSIGTAPADGFFTPAPFRGAFSPTNNWLKGWTAADVYGWTDTSHNPADPAETLTVSGTTATVSFPTVNGVVYSVEKSTDNVNWSPMETFVGNGSTKTVTDTAATETVKFYRAIAQ